MDGWVNTMRSIQKVDYVFRYKKEGHSGTCYNG